MIATSTLYNSIFAGQHSVEWRITINGTVYGMDKISASVGGGNALPHIHRQLFSDNSPATGACVSATFECSIFEASENVPRMATVVPSYRIKNDTQTSEWITLGTFYIDTRAFDKATGILTLSCYDRMLVADGVGGKSYADVTAFTTWPQSMSDVVTEIATIMGITIDARTSINTGTGYMVNYPNDLTMREVLSYIAVAHAGCWTITPDNKLRLISITGGTDTINLGTNTKQLSSAPPFSAWSGVTVYWDDEESYEAGDDTGRVMVCDCPWATQDTADGILSVIDDVSYQPFTTGTAFINLAVELGDIVTVGLPGETVTAPMFTIDIVAETIEAATVSAEGEEEIDHEYPFSDYVDRSLKRKVTLGQNYYGTEITRENGLQIFRSDGKSDVTLNSDRMVFRGLIDGVMKDQIYFDPVSGRYIFDGALGADAIFTDSLYAETGDVSELTVDRLSTSRRIRKYILGDTSDDNYIKIQDQYIQLITGTLKRNVELLTEGSLPILTETDIILLTEAEGSGGELAPPVQAANRYGQPLYWQDEPVGHTAEGYPTDADGNQIYATTDVTDWAVYTYAYDELVKAQLAFDQLGSGDNYIPTLIMGAGNGAGLLQGFIRKSESELQIWYQNAQNQNRGIYMGEYTDIVGLRQTTQMDFSAWDSGHFSEIIDGGNVNSYMVQFDDQDRPVLIRDAQGHETEVVW